MFRQANHPHTNLALLYIIIIIIIIIMENEPHHHSRQNSFHLPPPTPSRQGGSIRHRSLSPSILKATARDADGQFACFSPRRRSFGPRPGIPNSPSPSRTGLRSSPLASRTLSELNTPSREEAILLLSPVQLHFMKPRPLQALPPATPPADVSTSLCTSACSTPSSPFMELIYSASASTAETPDIFRQLDDEAKETPVMANPRHFRTRSGDSDGGDDSSSKCTYSLQSMIHESNSAPRHGVPATWVVPRILHTTTLVTTESMTTNNNNEKGSTSPFSLPSMLGATDASYESEEISELDSPMLFSATTEASDIQSRSEATDIYSLRTTPTHTLETMISSANGGEENGHAAPLSPLAPKSVPTSTSPEEPDTRLTLPGPLVRCDAHDELDDLTECDSASTPNPAATTPSLTQLASSSGLLLSRQQVIDAAASYDSDSEILNEDPYIRRLQQRHARSTKEQAQPIQKKANRRWMVHSQLFFQSPQTVQFTDLDGDDGMISELSSHQGDTRDVEQGGAKAIPADSDAIVPAAATMTSSSDSASSARSSRCFFAQSRLGLVCRLVTIVLLALCILAPLVGFFLHSRLQSTVSDIDSSNSTYSTDDENIGLTMFPKVVSSSPTQATTSQPTRVVAVSTKPPTAGEATSAPTLSPTQIVATLVPTVGATVTSLPPTSFPSQAGLPTLPPVQSVWDEDAWTRQNGSSSPGPRWETTEASSLEMTIINSLTNPTHSDVLEATIQDWEESSVRFNVVVDRPSTPLTSIDDCIPTLGKIHICNGNFGETTSRFFSNVYVNGQQQIIAATVLQNDQFGIEGSDLLDVTPESLAYNYCHELGHSLGLFHTTQGCMVEHILLEDFSESLFVRPDPSDLETLDAMYGP